MERSIVKTSDGSHTLYAPEIDEHYHSIKGAKSESIHIFIETGLRHAIETRHLKDINILEIGFGTGLNAILTLDFCKRHNCKIKYHTTELYPLDWKSIATLNITDHPHFEELHNAPWGKPYKITPLFTINKWHIDARHVDVNEVDVVYLDAFSPEKQPELWDETFLHKLYNLMSNGGVLTTYCAKGEIRRRLQNIGFIVERLPGPIGGKREILRATKA